MREIYFYFYIVFLNFLKLPTYVIYILTCLNDMDTTIFFKFNKNNKPFFLLESVYLCSMIECLGHIST